MDFIVSGSNLPDMGKRFTRARWECCEPCLFGPYETPEQPKLLISTEK